MKLTIGMAHFSDWEGLHSTVQSLAIHHALTDVELIVVDNSPNTEAGRMVARLVETWKWRGASAKYVPLADAVGTSVPRDRIFREATGDIVLVMDCHVLLPAGAIGRLRTWYEQHPDSGDIVSGPMYYDSLRDWSTHFDERWRSEMWGTWGQAWRCRCGGGTFAAFDKMLGETSFLTLSSPQRDITVCPACGGELPRIPWPGHEPKMVAEGYYRLGQDINEPAFEIPGHGLGLFSCRREAWQGFHLDARGFGGEELWIHDKFRKAGSRAICLPFLRWVHRFGRTHRLEYPLSRYGKVRNYVLEFQQTGRALDPIYEHFVSLDTRGMPLAFHLVAEHGVDPATLKGKTEEQMQVIHRERKLSEATWKHLLADPVKHEQFVDPSAAPIEVRSNHAQPSPNSTLDTIYDWCRSVKRDLDEHLPKIRELASQCRHVTAIVKRREWDVAVLAARPETYVSHSAENDTLIKTLHEAVRLDQNIESAIESTGGQSRPPTHTYTTHASNLDDLSGVEIEDTDMLILDTIHSADRVQLELERHAPRVRHWVLVRGTGAFGLKAESGGGPGLEQGIGTFIAAHKEWRRVWFTANQYGMTLLSRDPSERSIDQGPGTELHKILSSLGINPSAACDCRAKARQMDVWGPVGCRENRETIVGWMRAGHERWGWKDKLAAAAKAVTTGLVFVLDWSDPFPSLVDESIHRAEEIELSAPIQHSLSDTAEVTAI